MIGSQLFNYLSEIMLVYLLFMYVYLFDDAYPPIIPFTAMTLAGIGMLAILWSRSTKFKELSGMKLLMGMMPLIIVGWISGLPLWQSLLVTFAMSWTIYLNLKEPDRVSNISSVFLCFIGAVAYYLVAPASELKSFVYIIPSIQFLFLLCSRTSKQLRNEGPTGKSALWAVSTIMLLFVFVVSGGFMFLTLRPFILKGISTVIGGVSYVIGLPVYWLTLLLTFNSGDEDLDSFRDATNGEPIKTDLIDQNHATSTFNYEPFLYLLVTVIIVILAIVIVRKRLVFSDFNPRGVTYTISEASTNGVETNTRIKSKPPANVIRKLTYQLEIKAIKYGYQREKSETLSEWYVRLPGYSDEKNHMVSVYEKIRYANKSITEEEVLQYKACVKIFLQEMKRSKKRKENQQH